MEQIEVNKQSSESAILPSQNGSTTLSVEALSVKTSCGGVKLNGGEDYPYVYALNPRCCLNHFQMEMGGQDVSPTAVLVTQIQVPPPAVRIAVSTHATLANQTVSHALHHHLLADPVSPDHATQTRVLAAPVRSSVLIGKVIPLQEIAKIKQLVSRVQEFAPGFIIG